MDTNNLFSPGQWIVGRVANGQNAGALGVFAGVFAGDRFYPVCLVSPQNKITPEDEANANLISAAPEMFSAIEALLKDYENCLLKAGLSPKQTGPFVEARKALEKAKGNLSPAADAAQHLTT